MPLYVGDSPRANRVHKVHEASVVLGSDEAGYGAWAGPLLVAGVLASRSWTPPVVHLRGRLVLITDSKQMEADEREAAYDVLVNDDRIRYSIFWGSHTAIDDIGVGRVLPEGHWRVHGELIDALDVMQQDTFIQIADGNLDLGPDVVSLPRADANFVQVSAASILAKVTHDRHMREMAVKYPGYGFESHQGYGGSKLHTDALTRLGPCEIHRRSYAPIAALLQTVKQPQNLWELLDDD